MTVSENNNNQSEYDFSKMDPEVRKELRDKVLKMRNFHYENFNKWSTYFYIIIGALFVGYYSVAGESGVDDVKLIILLLGYIVSVFWHLSNKGYVYWELHWTAFLKDIESKMKGKEKNERLYSVFYWGDSETKGINYGCYWNPISPASVSTSNITLLMSFIVAVCWGCLLYINWFGVPHWFCDCCCGECCYRCIHIVHIVLMILIVTGVNILLTMGCGYLLKSKVENHEIRRNCITDELENNGYSPENNKKCKDLFRCKLFKDQRISKK